ncbi:MAG: GGDEF domain-containing protein [Desulfobacteraceae bacterium]|nr:GGDEF domain-containing protein [Desulfobacteraceae bacterium]
MLKNKISIDYTNKKIFRYFFIIFLIFGSFLAGTIGVLYNLESKVYLKQLKLEEQVNLKLQLALISNKFNTIISDLLFLSKQNELLRLINFDETDYKKWISNEYLELSRKKKVYDQIRYLDKTGIEIVRVNYNNGNPKIVKENNLQFKGNRYYFKDTFALGPNEIFVSPLDLNIENGQIEKPLKPMIRFGTPVFNNKKQKTGVILFNYLGEEMLALIGETASLSPGNAMLLNRDGFWLFSPDKEDEWGFMIESRQKKNFSIKYPSVWTKMLSSENCQIDNIDGLFTCVTIFPLKQSIEEVKSSSGSSFAIGESQKEINPNEYYWKLVSHIPKQEINFGIRSLFIKLFFLAILLFLSTSIPSWIIAKAIVRRKVYQTELYRSANYDKLTNLPNRSMFMDIINQELKQSKRYERKFALLFIDLDGFKAVNDTLGHDTGDRLLIEVASRLQTGVRDSDTVARLGGDEFTVIFSMINSLTDAGLGAQKIIENLSVPFNIKNQDIKISASIGVSVYPDNGDDVERLLLKSDSAMYLAKKEGKNTYRLSSVKSKF